MFHAWQTTSEAATGLLLAIAFGVWDIFYYAFLRLIVGWPQSLWDWDVLFLIPLPWWGPVLAPVAIAVLLIVGATLVTQSPQPVWPARRSWDAVAVAAPRRPPRPQGLPEPPESRLSSWPADRGEPCARAAFRPGRR